MLTSDYYVASEPVLLLLASCTTMIYLEVFVSPVIREYSSPPKQTIEDNYSIHSICTIWLFFDNLKNNPASYFFFGIQLKIYPRWGASIIFLRLSLAFFRVLLCTQLACYCSSGESVVCFEVATTDCACTRD